MEPSEETLNDAFGDDFDAAEARDLGWVEQV
jgi:hypothetical protein